MIGFWPRVSPRTKKSLNTPYKDNAESFKSHNIYDDVLKVVPFDAWTSYETFVCEI